MANSLDDLAGKLWEATDNLRNFPVPKYSIVVLGIIFLKFADQRFVAIERKLQKEVHQPGGRHIKLTTEHYKANGAIYLDEKARFSYLRHFNGSLGNALDHAMCLIERDNAETLAGALPNDVYAAIDDYALRALLAVFDNVSLKDDLLAKLYEYFLNKFALTEGQGGGEFFTPPSVVRLVTEIVEPSQGLVFDPACGSGGMLIQSAQFVQRQQRDPCEEISLYGQEVVPETAQLCKMNLAIHGFSGDVRHVQHADSFYDDPYGSTNRFDFVLSTPPFNMKGVDKLHLLDSQQHVPFGIPDVDNANYLWIQLFYNALKETGRAGFMMPNSASNVGNSEQDIRRKLILDQVVDIIVSVNSNFLYTETLPYMLWFFDKSKRNTRRGNKVLFIDARQLYRQTDRTHRNFAEEQIEFLANIVRLYRGESIEAIHDNASFLYAAFSSGKYVDVPGLCKVATLVEIEAREWSLNPIQYVGSEHIVVPANKRTKVFISYSHKDKDYLKRLRVHLDSLNLKEEIGIDIWDDTRILPGDMWREEIRVALSCAKVAILLVSPDFLASQFIKEDELPPLLVAAKKEEAVILPVILSPCAFRDSQLADFQAVNDPSRPLTSRSRNNKEKIWDEVASRVREIMASKG